VEVILTAPRGGLAVCFALASRPGWRDGTRRGPRPSAAMPPLQPGIELRRIRGARLMGHRIMQIEKANPFVFVLLRKDEPELAVDVHRADVVLVDREAEPAGAGRAAFGNRMAQQELAQARAAQLRMCAAP